MTICLCHGGMCEPSIRCSWPLFSPNTSPVGGPALPHGHRMFKINDKEMRKHVVSHIINDVKRLNAKSKNQRVNNILLVCLPPGLCFLL